MSAAASSAARVEEALRRDIFVQCKERETLLMRRTRLISGMVALVDEL